MADRKIIYDFGTALRKLIESQGDLVEIITKWEEMLDTTPRMVSFNLADGEHVVPNVQMVIDEMNRTALPTTPTFKFVTSEDSDGTATLRSTGVSMRGKDGSAAAYSAKGISGGVYQIIPGSTVLDWPISRYWSFGHNQAITTQVGLSPDIPPSNTDTMCDFFVYLLPGQTLVLEFKAPGGNTTSTLNCPGSAPVI